MAAFASRHLDVLTQGHPASRTAVRSDRALAGPRMALILAVQGLLRSPFAPSRRRLRC